VNSLKPNAKLSHICGGASSLREPGERIHVGRRAAAAAAATTTTSVKVYHHSDRSIADSRLLPCTVKTLPYRVGVKEIHKDGTEMVVEETIDAIGHAHTPQRIKLVVCA
jgi:hypothetical protein